MHNRNQEEGKWGEEAATRYLVRCGFQIIERNFRIRGGEIDIIATEKDNYGEEVLVFIEVKTRSTGKYGSPLEAITPWKLRALRKAAQFYKLKNPRLPELLRIDAISVTYDPQTQLPHIELVKNIS